MSKQGLNQYIKIIIQVIFFAVLVGGLFIGINYYAVGENKVGDLYYTDTKRIIDKGEQVKIVQFGASTAQSGINTKSFPEVEIMASSAQSLEEMFLLIDYLEKMGYRYTKDNYLLLDVGTSTIRKVSGHHNMAAVANINTWGDFKVSDDLELIRKSYVTSHIKRYLFPIEQNADKLWNGIQGLFSVKAQAAESYQNVYEAQLAEWNDFCKDFTYLSEEQKKEFEDKLLELNQRSNVIINFVYITQAHADAEEGKIFNAYIDDELKPFLEKHDISYIDSRSIFDWEDYSDRAHLTAQGQEKYTDFMIEQIMAIINKTE